eukprot:gene9437-4855_t
MSGPAQARTVKQLLQRRGAQNLADPRISDSRPSRGPVAATSRPRRGYHRGHAAGTAAATPR